MGGLSSTGLYGWRGFQLARRSLELETTLAKTKTRHIIACSNDLVDERQAVTNANLIVLAVLIAKRDQAAENGHMSF
jgi:hypothetical protein